MNQPATGPAPNRTPVLVIVGVLAVAVLLAIIAIVASGDDGDDTVAGVETTTTAGGGVTTADPGDDEDETTTTAGGLIDETAGPVTVTGASLPQYVGGLTVPEDDAIGLPFPGFEGTGLDGRPLSIGPGDGPVVVVFLAHWCPHCQVEVPVLVDLIDQGVLPEGVDLVGVSTAMDSRRPNYPASTWLEAEGWRQPTLMDTEDTAAFAAGLTSFPFFVFVDENGEVAARGTGELSPEVILQLVDLIDPAG